jgi:hypothetical protein
MGVIDHKRPVPPRVGGVRPAHGRLLAIRQKRNKFACFLAGPVNAVALALTVALAAVQDPEQLNHGGPGISDHDPSERVITTGRNGR